MISVDTNILVRILIDDKSNQEQVVTARKFAEKNVPLFIPQLVQAELVWVLSYSYDLEKLEILKILKHLLENAAFIMQEEQHFERAIHQYETTNVNFSDCLILQSSLVFTRKIATFDKKFAKLPEVFLVT